MQTMKIATLLASAAALGLAGCDNEPDAVDAEIVDTEETLSEAWDSDAYPVAGEMSEQAQTNYDAMDRQAVSDEYDANRDTLMAQRDGSANAPAEGGDEPTASGDASADSSGAMTLPPRSEMDFAWLDRNGDGKLSVAEYAIWAVPANPATPVPNDSTKPYLTQDQINEAGQTFFYFDEDGSTYLSESEFMEARNSAVAPA